MKGDKKYYAKLRALSRCSKNFRKVIKKKRIQFFSFFMFSWTEGLVGVYIILSIKNGHAYFLCALEFKPQKNDVISILYAYTSMFSAY